jgi:hypothetical protein
VVIRYLMKVSGYSRQQLTRLIAQYRKTGQCPESPVLGQTVTGYENRIKGNNRMGR